MATLPRDQFPGLYSTLDTLRASFINGVQGVIRIDSGKRGPILGITACTHGNEPSGLAVIEHLLGAYDLVNNITRGTVILGVNNINAATNYFDGGSAGASNRYRFIDQNMNRLPDDIVTSDRHNLEIERARELLPIWSTFDVGFDIHSTSQESRPMIINNGSHLHRDLVRGFPISTIISNIDVVQIGLPAFGYYGNKDTKPGTPVMEIEAGSHEDPASFARAITCSLALLQNLEMISRDTDSLDGVVTEYREYQVFGSVVFPNDSYRVVRCFKDFERVAAGTVFAKGNGAPLVAERDCLTLFCPDENRIPDWKLTQEEAMYLLDL